MVDSIKIKSEVSNSVKKEKKKKLTHNKNYFIMQFFIYVYKIKFWLILPVVICLSQRLSHACLSTSENKVKPQKAHYISYGSLDRIKNYLDNCGNSRANTCI